MFCFAPIVLIGMAMTMDHNVMGQHSSGNANGTVIEVMTCEKGPGLDVKASTAGLYGLGLQYGVTVVEVGDWSLTVLPKMGLSYSDKPRRELPMQGQFEVGAQVLVGYQAFRAGLEYWHLSNAGIQQPNIGLDMLVVQTGWRF